MPRGIETALRVTTVALLIVAIPFLSAVQQDFRFELRNNLEIQHDFPFAGDWTNNGTLQTNTVQTGDNCLAIDDTAIGGTNPDRQTGGFDSNSFEDGQQPLDVVELRTRALNVGSGTPANITIEVSDDNFATVEDSETIRLANGSDSVETGENIASARQWRFSVSLATTTDGETPQLCNATFLVETFDETDPFGGGLLDALTLLLVLSIILGITHIVLAAAT